MSETLEQDFITVPGQLYALISVIGPECPQKTDKHGIKIRGVFNTRDEAGSHAQRLQKADPTFDIYVVDMYKWLLIPPDTTQIDDVTYQEEFLQKMMTEYKQNQSDAKRMFEERKAGMMQKPKEGSDMPFMTPGDDNSKYYTKPDVAPSKHPSEYLRRTQGEEPRQAHGRTRGHGYRDGRCREQEGCRGRSCQGRREGACQGRREGARQGRREGARQGRLII